jgi:glycosyltransferase involved in cell wall biosynthesis
MVHISVVIPLYNKEKYIRRAVDSVLSQSFRDFELIVVNDGSTDNGPALVRQYDDSRVRVLDQENRGVSAARNRGIAEAHGELVVFLDADDEWSSDFLEVIAALVRRFPHAGAYFTGWRLLTHERNISRVLRIGSQDDTCGCYFDLLAKGGSANASCIAVQRSVLHRLGGFRTSHRRGEDGDLSISAL